VENYQTTLSSSKSKWPSNRAQKGRGNSRPTTTYSSGRAWLQCITWQPAHTHVPMQLATAKQRRQLWPAASRPGPGGRREVVAPWRADWHQPSGTRAEGAVEAHGGECYGGWASPGPGSRHWPGSFSVRNASEQIQSRPRDSDHQVAGSGSLIMGPLLHNKAPSPWFEPHGRDLACLKIERKGEEEEEEKERPTWRGSAAAAAKCAMVAMPEP
jgi:hypothetical protein